MSVSDKDVAAPAGFVPQAAIAFGQDGATAIGVDRDHPLPVDLRVPAADGPPLAGEMTGTAEAGPFLPTPGRPIRLTLAGEWLGWAELRRSVDGGATRDPLTLGGQPWGRFSRPVNEVVAEEHEAGASYWLAGTIDSGTLRFRVAQ